MLQARPELEQIKEYVPGKSIREIQNLYGLEKVVKLASNENPLGPSPKALEAFCAMARELHLYPQGSAPELLAALSSHLGVPASYLVPGNGSDEILDMVGRAYIRPGDKVLGASSTFSVYESVAKTAGATYVPVPLRDWTYDLNALHLAIDDRTRVIFICNPNNPTGTYVGEAQLLAFLDAVPSSVLVVVDQAYCEFSDALDYPHLLGKLDKYPNLLLTRTFSKIYGLAGLRVGYGIGAPSVVAPLWKVKPPFNVALPAQFAAVEALRDEEHYARTLEVTQAGRAYMEQKLGELGYGYLPTQANFLCIHIGENAGKLVSWMESQGLIVRWLKSFGMPDYIRVTFGLQSENEEFVRLLGAWSVQHG